MRTIFFFFFFFFKKKSRETLLEIMYGVPPSSLATVATSSDADTTGRTRKCLSTSSSEYACVKRSLGSSSAGLYRSLSR